MKTGKIAVGTDFSEPSDRAVEQTMHLARHLGAEVVLVHAGTIAEHRKAQFGSHDKDVHGWAEQVFAHNRKTLEEFRVRLTGQGVEVSQAFHEGLPGSSLCEAATELSADLLVVGSHSFSGVTRFLLGNVAERVVRNSEQSVLVARSAGQAGGFKRILVPLDLEGDSYAAIEMALALASKGGEVELLHCWQLPHAFAESWRPGPGGSPALEEIRESTRGQVKEKLGELSQKQEKEGISIRMEEVEASPREGIVQRLDASDYDLVIVQSRGGSGAQRWLQGSVADSTARHATCSVLVLKSKAPAP